MDLLEYLNKYYAGTISGLEADMADKFGVSVKHSPQFPKLWLFKYDMITVKWSRPLPHMCRGTICELTHDGEWKLVSYPFDKFFNFHEPNCSLTAEEYAHHPQDFRLAEKADGTCIQVYKYEDVWRASTLGTIATLPLYTDGPTFEDLFWDTIKQQYNLDYYTVCTRLDKCTEDDACTLLFELCTSQNRIVTRYKNDRVYLLGVRQMLYDCRMLTPGEVQYFADELGVRRPRFISCHDLPTMEKVKEFVEAEGQLEGVEDDPEVQYPEGYIVYQGGIPKAKLKNARYLVLHSVMGGENDRYVARRLAEALFENALDDILAALSDHQIAGIDYMREALRELNNTAMQMATQLHDWLSETDLDQKELRKEYALRIQELTKDLPTKPKGWVSGYFFRNFDKIRDGFLGEFTGHLKAEAQRTKDNLGYWRDYVLEGMAKSREQDSK